jgi:hypothetical protein
MPKQERRAPSAPARVVPTHIIAEVEDFVRAVIVLMFEPFDGRLQNLIMQVRWPRGVSGGRRSV